MAEQPQQRHDGGPGGGHEPTGGRAAGIFVGRLSDAAKQAGGD
jgi:hypothetical protein